MPPKTHVRKRSSIDRVFELLADLEDNQISLLLDDLNHTTPSNVPVSQAIALFDPGNPRPRRKTNERSSSPIRTLQAELERRHSKRLSSVPEPLRRPAVKTIPEPRAPLSSMDSLPDLLHSSSPSFSPNFDAPSTPPSQPEPPSLSLSFAEPISLTLSLPKSAEIPQRSSGSTTPEHRARSYKRINRPMLLSPTATAELHGLLMAYLNGTTSSNVTTAESSPITPPTGTGFSHSFFSFEDELEPDCPGLDFLEPSPTRTRNISFGGASGGLKPKPSMSSIFEVMGSN
ncbi:hypothetical protein QBC38DRAFT_487400 [Podospora fimiseda]|uniref:Uncharacterized protein n=1 Tax=Podospora fimiseda TaxID=252190 RepID=A0AAN7BI17_9PEZI|nr:hypothetical protein QBC38DRAFT_487400 [Podospora fimiseda]